MLDLDREICVCNNLNIKEIATCIKSNNFKNIDEMVTNNECPMGDKCENCHEDGYENDGYSLAMVLSLVKNGRI